jgi:hypothetical protein
MASLRAKANVSGAPSTGSPSPSLPVRSAGPSVSFAGLPLGRRNRSAPTFVAGALDNQVKAGAATITYLAPDLAGVEPLHSRCSQLLRHDRPG